MKQINLKTFIFGALLMSGVFGCSLEEGSYGIINDQSLWKSERDAETGIIYCYANLPEVGYMSRGWYIVTELPTENLSQKGDAGNDNFELDEWRTTPTNLNLFDMWTYIYRSVARSNAVIENVPNIVMDPVKRDQIVGEAYFLRALNYFNLVRLYGEVPVRPEVIVNASQIPKAKSSIEEVYDLILADLTQAEQLMTSMRISEGRANKVAAWALLSKVYLHLASSKATDSPGYEFVADADNMYSQARTWSGKVINDQTTFGFTDQLVDIWNTDIYKTAAVTEHIFDAAVDRSGAREGDFSKLPNMFLPADRPMEIHYDPTDASSPLINIGQGWSHFRTESNIYDAYASNDKRKTQLIVSEYWNGGNHYNLDITSSSRPFTRKFIDPKRVGDASSCNSPILRYSDILLVYAEASGPTVEGYSAINKIRNRAGIGDLSPNLSITDFRLAVINERKFELAFEGSRLFDLRRTHSVEAVMESLGKTVTSGAYFFYIPQWEVDTNPLMTQHD